MRIGAFEIADPLPELRDPHALAILQPWIDVGNVGTLVLSRLESLLNASDLGRLSRPGTFYDFTRYRPVLYLKEGRRELGIPNTSVSYGRSEGGKDFLLLRLLEPHMQAETYIDSVLELFTTLGVKSYGLLGSMYDMMPHTRPLLVTGSGSNLKVQNEMETAKVQPSEYVGPTTIALLITQNASEMGIETFTMIVHLPQYLAVENDYRGEVRLMEVLGSLYGFPIAQEDLDEAAKQAASVSHVAERLMQQEPRYRPILKHLEALYDSRVNKTKEESRLSPELEQLVQDLSQRFSRGQ
ncbi:MAG: PAC2 family protein [Dehalococcoidia bacterium]|nr:PAC2 family protein [Dehalococcoidia bacterium]